MRKLFFTLLLINAFINCFSQTELQHAAEVSKITVQIPPSFYPPHNEEPIYVTPVREECPEPTEKQLNGDEEVFASTAFKVFFGKVTGIIRSQDCDCVVFIYIDNTKTPFDRIKRDFRFGQRNEVANKNETEALNQMITHYSKHKAKKMFNADWAVGYPYNLAGQSYENKYKRAKAIVAGKEDRNIFLYFMLTEKGEKNFNKYQKELSGAFKFK